MLVKGETVLFKFEDVRLLGANNEVIEQGTLWITDYQIIFRPSQASNKDCLSKIQDVYLPLGTISHLVERTKKGLLIKLECKDFRTLSFAFANENQYHSTHKTLKERLNAKPVYGKSTKISSASRPFCLNYKESISLKDYDGWQVYSPQTEYERLNLLNSPWKYAEFNAAFKVCHSMATWLVLPETFIEDEAIRFSKNRPGNYLPMIHWRLPSSTAFLASYYVRQSGIQVNGDESFYVSLFNSMGSQQQLLHLVTPLMIRGVRGFYDLEAFPGQGPNGIANSVGGVVGEAALQKILKTRCKVIGFGLETVSELAERLCRLQAFCSCAVLEAEPFLLLYPSSSSSSSANSLTSSSLSTSSSTSSVSTSSSSSSSGASVVTSASHAGGSSGSGSPGAVPLHTVIPSPSSSSSSSSVSSSEAPSTSTSFSAFVVEWVSGIQQVLNSAFQIVTKIESLTSILFQNSDERSLQHISSLALLLLDPHYRTLQGFEMLIEKEWCSTGHRFQRRVDQEKKDKKSRGGSECLSPLFVQFIDCVWQLTQQFPLSFQFNEDLLVFILDSISSARFGTFLSLSEKERHEFDIRHTTLSIWTYVNYHSAISAKFINQNYQHNPNKLHPFANHVIFWSAFYLRYSKNSALRLVHQRLAPTIAHPPVSPTACLSSIPILPSSVIANLTSCKLLFLPNPSFEPIKFAHVQQVFLDKNYLNTFPLELLHLPLLQKIDLGENQLSLIPPELVQLIAVRLPDLRELSLRKNRLDYFPDVELLSNLEYLDLSSNSLTKMPLGLAQLKNLTHLNISQNVITNIDVRLDKLTNLQSLNLSDNRTIDRNLASVGFKQPLQFSSNLVLVQLTEMNLDKLDLNQLPSESFATDLPALKVLSLNLNRFECFPKELLTMSQLESLFLDNNQISLLPPEIAQMTNMRVLSLGNNQIRTISHAIGQLSSTLLHLNLANNNLTGLPPQFGLLTNLECLQLEGNPYKPNISGGIQALLTFLKETLAGSHALFRTKLMVIGQDNVGKSTLLRWITTKKKITNRLDELSTDGVEISEWSFYTDRFNDKGGKNKIQIDVSTWDFAGQDLYYTTHQFFLTPRSVYLLVFNMALPEEDSRIEYWLQMIQTRAPDCPIVLAGTHLDEAAGNRDSLHRDLWEKYGRRYPNINSIYFVSTQHPRSLEKLKDEIKSIILSLDYMGAPFPSSFIELERLMKGERNRMPPLMNWSEYQSLASLCNIEPEELKVATKLLHNLGSIFHFDQRSGDLENMIILNPQWLTNTMSSIITTKHKYVKDGILAHNSLQYIWRPPYYPLEVHSSLLTLLQRFEIIFTLNSAFSSDLIKSPGESCKSPSVENQNDGKDLDTNLLTQKLNETAIFSSPTLSTTDAFSEDNNILLRSIERSDEIGKIGEENLDFQQSFPSTLSSVPNLSDITSPRKLLTDSGSPVSQNNYLTNNFLINEINDSSSSMSGTNSRRTSTTRMMSSSYSSKTGTPPSSSASHISIRSTMTSDISTPSHKFLSPIPNYPFMDGCSLVPCLLPTNRPKELQDYWPRFSSSSQYGRIYQFDFIPTGLFSRLMIRLLNLPLGESRLFWRTGVLLQFPNESCLIEMFSVNKEISITVRGSTVVKLGLIIKTFDDLLADCEWKKLNVHIFVPCVHCVEERSYDPFRFPLMMCESAARNGKPFVLCYGIRPIRIDTLVPDITLIDVQSAIIKFSEVKVKEKIGEGGFAQVFRAKYHKQVVALKKLNFSANVEEFNESEQLEAFRQFRHEVWIMSGLDHENIVTMKGYCINPCCLVTEFMEFGNLYNFLHKPTNEIDVRLSLRIAHDTAKGCAFLHNCCPKIIHRDLKSPNILLASTRADAPVVAKVSDFGVSQVLVSTIANQPVQNPIWLAPELMRKEEYTEKADVYAFGVILWEICSREDFFGEESFMTKIIQRVLNGDRPPVPSDSLPQYADLIRRCWHNEPTSRPPFNDCVDVLAGLITTDIDTGPKKREARVVPLTKQPSATWRYISPEEKDVNRVYMGSSFIKSISVNNNTSAETNQNVSKTSPMVEKRSKSVTANTGSEPSPILRRSSELKQRFREGIYSLRFKTSVERGSTTESYPGASHNNNHNNLSHTHPKIATKAATSSKLNSGSTSVQCLLLVSNRVWSGHSCGTINIWNANTGELVDSLNLHSNKVFALALVDGFVFSGSLDGNNSIVAWDSKGKYIRTLSTVSVCSLAGVDDQIWAGTSEQTVLIISTKDLKVKKIVKLESGSVQSMLYYRGAVWAGTDNLIARISSQTNKIVGYCQGHTQTIHSIIGVGNYVWSSSSDKTIRVWSASSGELHKVLEGHGSRVFTLMNENNRYVWSGSWDCSLYIWNAETLVFVKEHKGKHTDAMTCLLLVATEGEPSVWSGSWDSTISIWTLQGRASQARVAISAKDHFLPRIAEVEVEP